MTTQAPASKPGAALGAGEVRCPDPSLHEKNSQLQEQASTAALYVTNPSTRRSPSGNASESDHHLSSSGAAHSLRHARAEDLPSYPVVGIDKQSSAGAAASLANAHHQSFEHWKPGSSRSAGNAALLAHKDARPHEPWAPEASSTGSHAAISAQRDSRPVPPIVDVQDTRKSVVGNAAAGKAMRGATRSPVSEVEARADSQRRALLGATGAYSGRRRAGSTPVPVPHESYPDEANSKYNALNAATLASRPPTNASTRTHGESGAYRAALDAARIQNIGPNVSKQMWTDKPPVAIEVEEKRHKEALRASTISMAKSLYDVQAKMNEESAGRARTAGQAAAVTSAQDARPSTSEKELKSQAMQYIHIQEAAKKLAEERLAKILPDEQTAFRQYYGYGPSNRRSRLSIRGMGHRRSSSEGAMVDPDDEDRSRRIRKQMGTLNQKVAMIDEKKRQDDRQSLMATAERLVHSRMHDLDEKVFMETGKVPPSVMEEWEAKAKAKAAAESEARLANHGKVHVGGGKFLDQSEIDAVALSRVQPTLDQITDQAEKQRAKDEEVRLDLEHKKRQEASEREKKLDLENEQKRVKNEEKNEEKAKKAEEKHAQKLEKDAEKARKSEEKRLQKEDKRKSKETSKSYISSDAGVETDAKDIREGETERTFGNTTEVAAEHDSEEQSSSTGPTRFKSLMDKLKRRSKHNSTSSDMTQSETADPKVSSTTDDAQRSPSISSLSSSASERSRGRSKARGSDVSVESDKGKGKEKTNEKENDAPLAPPAIPQKKAESPARDSRFTENL